MSDFYGFQQLINSGAETGDTTGWTAINSSAVTPGISGSYCFQVGSSGSLSQSVTPTQPEDIKVTGSFLPQNRNSEDEQIEARIRVRLIYSDGTSDYHIIPCEPGVS